MAVVRAASGAAGDVVDRQRNEALRRFRIELTLVGLVVLLVATFGSTLRWFEALDRLAFDTIVRLAPLPARDDILIVGIDAQSLSFVGRWPWPRETQSALIAAILRAAPKALFVDVIYSERGTAESDAMLAETFAANTVTALPVLVDAVTQGGMLIEELPFPELLASVSVLGHVHVQLEGDGITRGSYLYEGIGAPHWPHVALALHERLTGVRGEGCPAQESEWSLANERCAYRRIRFAGPPGQFDHISAVDLIEGRVPAEILHDKVVLLGRTDISAPDTVPASVSAESRPMAGVEYNANMLNAISGGGLLTPAGAMPTIVLTLLCVGVALLVLPRLQPRPMLMVAVGLAALPLALMVVGFFMFSASLELASASVGSALVYPLWAWRRNEMGWRYVGEELDRLAGEAFRWSRNRARVPSELLPERMQWLLDRPLGELPGHGDRDLLEEEIDLLDRVLSDQRLGELHAYPSADPFVARLLRIRSLADEVRIGREVSLAGLDQMPVGLCVFAGSGNVLLANDTFLQLTGRTDSRHSFFVLEALNNLPEVPWQQIVREVVKSGRAQAAETRTSDDKRLHARLARLAVSGYAQPVCMVTLTDVTDIRLAQERREETLAFVSHDLRSPISSILALVRNPGNDDWPDLARRVEAYARRSLQVSEQFVQLSRVENTERLDKHELDLVLLVESAVDQVYTEAQQSRHVITVQAAESLPDAGWIDGNGELLERVFVNLLENAMKYSEPGTSIDLRIRASADREIAVDVADRGYGIPQSEVGRIFDPYFRSSSRALAKERGVGLGLRFVRTVVEGHGGRVVVESEEGVGSCFSVYLPCGAVKEL